jgi:hypothetical protein
MGGVFPHAKQGFSQAASLVALLSVAGPSHLPSWYTSPEDIVAQQQPTGQPPDPDTELKAGNFGAVRSLLRVLASGVESKAMLDEVIDACRYALCEPSVAT